MWEPRNQMHRILPYIVETRYFLACCFNSFFMHAKNYYPHAVIIQVTLKLKQSRDRRKGSVWKAYIKWYVV